MATLKEFYDTTRVRTYGAPDSTDRLWDRRLNLIVDGRALGDYEIGVAMDREASKRLDEMQALAYALVGCDAELEISEVRFLKPIPGKATADFDVRLRDGGSVLLELARLVDSNEKEYLNVIDRITGAANERLSTLSPRIQGRFRLRLYGDVPTARDVASASKELADFVAADVGRRTPSLTLWPAGQTYPTLHRLGAHVARLDAIKPFRIMVEPSRSVADPDATAAEFPRIVEQKKRKVSDYSNGDPVWLVLYVDTRLFYPLGIIETLRKNNTFDPRPFARVLVGCFTAGVSFLKADQAPTYTSLSSGTTSM